MDTSADQQSPRQTISPTPNVPVEVVARAKRGRRSAASPAERVRWNGRGFTAPGGGTFYPVGGVYANFICCEWAGIDVPDERLSRMSPFGGRRIMEFQDATEAELRAWLQYCQAEGFNYLRMFSRGSMRPVQDPLDVGGMVNQPLLDKMLHYWDLALEYGIRIHFVAVPEPRESLYMSDRVLGQRVLSHYGIAELGKLPPHRRRMLDTKTPRLTYDQFFSDPDATQCQLDYLEDLARHIKDHPALLCLEIYNEQQWGDTFFWHTHDAEIKWSARLVDRMHEVMPGVPTCCSHAGFGLAGHDPLMWTDGVPMDFYSPHMYQALCGRSHRADFAAIADTTLNYSGIDRPAILGECDPGPFPAHPETKQLLTRDLVWFSLLSQCPGFGMWMARSHGELELPARIASEIDLTNLKAKPPMLEVDISEQVAALHAIEQQGDTDCHLDQNTWCPHREQNDAEHRYCAKLTSRALDDLFNFSIFALRHGISYRFVREAKPGRELWPVRQTAVAAAKQLARPFVTERPWQVKYLSSEDETVHLVYVRSFCFLSEDVATGRVRPETCHCAIRLDLPAGAYEVEVHDLDTRDATKRQVDGKSALDLGQTNHDFAIVFRRQSD